MKVIAVNGSPRRKGNTAFALEVLCKEIQKAGIETEILHVGNKLIHGCIACNKCQENQNERCIINNDEVNEWLQVLKYADAVILGSPVYYAGIAGTMKCFLDRVFYVAEVNGGWFHGKIGASVVALRRGGATATFDSLNHFMLMSQMVVPSSSYWNMVHGLLPGEGAQDAEGIQIMENLGKNIVWLLQMKNATKDSVPTPDYDQRVMTNFIR